LWKNNDARPLKMKPQPGQTHSTLPRHGISISNRQRARKIDLRWLKKVTSATLLELKIENAELGIVLVGPKEMASLNEEFLGHEGATDVITFDYSSQQSAVRGPRMHGEIFVCVAEAERQAKLFRTDWLSEVVRYVVHGILHLTGHDDLQPMARKKMKREENRLVRKIVQGAG
jgi:probable rRNA maturation factor